MKMDITAAPSGLSFSSLSRLPAQEPAGPTSDATQDAAYVGAQAPAAAYEGAQPPAEVADKPAIDEDKLAEQVEKFNSAFRSADEYLKFTIHKETHQIMVKMIDANTEEVLREIPSEKFIDMVYNLEKLCGSQVDETR